VEKLLNSHQFVSVIAIENGFKGEKRYYHDDSLENCGTQNNKTPVSPKNRLCTFLDTYIRLCHAPMIMMERLIIIVSQFMFIHLNHAGLFQCKVN